MRPDASQAPAISVIVPVFNRADLIRECVQSVIDQSFDRWELLISDNDSTDGTREWLRTLNDPRIRVFEQETNIGLYANFEFLFNQSSAPLTYILCSDDYLLEDGLSRIVGEWARQPADVGFVRYNWNEKSVGRKALAPFVLKAIPQRIGPGEADLFFFLFGCFLGNISNVSVRTSALRDIPGFRPDLPNAADMEYWVRMGRRHRLALSSEEVTYVRTHPGQDSAQVQNKMHIVQELEKIVTDLFDRLEGRIPRALLRLHGTLAYDAMHRDIGLKLLLFRGDGAYLRNVDAGARSNPALLGVPGCWLLFFLSIGGRIGRAWSARLVLRASKGWKSVSERR